MFKLIAFPIMSNKTFVKIIILLAEQLQNVMTFILYGSYQYKLSKKSTLLKENETWHQSMLQILSTLVSQNA